ncbi:hypothetical protein [Natranaerobius trueperi]|uniref:hypothetical protein n=1 Tax=Natranaerobius trueperi TaxID=759412 RepID=UPI00197C9005|nr:hypothetical protein [Natranaerobius trueperi]
MPKRSKVEPKAKLSYTNGHFAYAFTGAVLTGGFGVIRDIELFEGQKDSTTLKPIMNSFKKRHDIQRTIFLQLMPALIVLKIIAS